MLRLVTFFCVCTAVTLAQAPGTNYQTGDGQVRSESVDADGNVKGQYSYVDPTGKTITVKYTAGKDGFQVEGDHIPRTADQAALAPPPNAQFAPNNQFAGFPQQFQGFPNSQNLFAAAPNAFGQPASQSQLTQFGQLPQLPIQGQPTAAQFSQIPSPAQFASPLGVPQGGVQQFQAAPGQIPATSGSPSFDISQAGAQQYSTAPAQFPAAPAPSPIQPPFSLSQLQANPQLSSSQVGPQFPASPFAGTQLSLNFPGSQQFANPQLVNPSAAQQAPAQFPSAPAAPTSQLFSVPNTQQVPGAPAGTQFLPQQNFNAGLPPVPHRFN